MQYLQRSIEQEVNQWQLFHCMWRKEAIPQEFKDASIIHQYNWQGNAQVCDNHRGISLLSIAGNILAKILLNRLNKHLDQAGRTSTRKSVRIREGQRNDRYDLYR